MNKKKIKAIKHPRPMFLPSELPCRVAGVGWNALGAWPGGGARLKGVPQFVQNLAVSGLASPQLGHVIVLPTVSDQLEIRR